MHKFFSPRKTPLCLPPCKRLWFDSRRNLDKNGGAISRKLFSMKLAGVMVTPLSVQQHIAALPWNGIFRVLLGRWLDVAKGVPPASYNNAVHRERAGTEAGEV